MSSAGHAPSIAAGGHGELSPDGTGSGPTRRANALVFVLSIALALAFWELLSRTGAISERDLPSMGSAVGELSSMAQTSHFWSAFGYTVRGWAVGLALASVLAIPLGVVLGLSDLGARAFRVPIEFLRPIPSAALIPLLFLTLGTQLQERGLPRNLWRLLADPRADDVRRS